MNFSKKLALTFVAGCAISSIAVGQSIDYNGDCVADFGDYLDFSNDYDLLNHAADLNLDGTVDSTDYDLFFSGAVPSLDFTVYWSVTNNIQVQCSPQRFPVAHGMDTQVDLSGLEISTNTGYLYQQDLLTLPIEFGVRAGLYLLLADRVCCPEVFVYTDWEDNWETSLDNIAAEIPVRLATMFDIDVEDLDQVTAVTTVNIETVPPDWQETIYRETVAAPFEWAGQQPSRWTYAVADINTPTWDSAFITKIDYLPPAGVTGAGGLNQTQLSALVRQAYNWFGVAYYAHIIQVARIHCPEAKFAYWGYPHVSYPETLTGPGSSGAINDELANLWPVLDVLAPFVYDYKASDPPTPHSPCNYTDTLADGTLFYQSALAEARRVRDTYAPTAKILPFLSFNYFLHDPLSCSGGTYLYPNDVEQQLRLPWLFGADENKPADGVLIWDSIQCSEPDAVDELSDIMQNEWGPIINAISCGTPLP